MLVPLRPSNEALLGCALFSLLSSKEWPDSPCPARIEGPQFHRGASASTKDCLAAPLPPLNILLSPSYNTASLA